MNQGDNMLGSVRPGRVIVCLFNQEVSVVGLTDVVDQLLMV